MVNPMASQLTTRMAELVSQRVPFVQATVVRAEAPTSAHAGDRAIVLPDGTIEGFVGGHCATGSVRTAALGALREGESVLLRVLPEGDDPFPDSPGARVVVNPCLSGGALEIFLEPQLPSPALKVVGATPTADAVAELAEALGFDVGRDEDDLEAAVAVVISSHGGDESGAIKSALAAAVPFIGLVASRARGSALLDDLGLTDEERSRVRTPVGLDIGARTSQEIGLSIVAELVKAVRRDGLSVLPAAARVPALAVDPVCGMSVTITADTATLTIEGEQYWFCTPGCRDAFAAGAGR
jgi:xanthine dehydrogenase accessory factor